MLVCKLHINVLESNEVVSEDKTINMVLFNGSCEGPYVQGTILDGGVDTQIYDKDGTGSLSARYIIQGVDLDNQPCKIFIENNATVGDDSSTHPIIYTDSKALKWLEKTELIGKIITANNELIIEISTKEE